jgi:8-oxo-dGTP pyrophosphatase MutT (NUDIX family)
MPIALRVPFRQSGVIPYRWDKQQLDVLLITSRRRSRWIIPKGMVEPFLSLAQSASREAYEEAGIRGSVASEAIGSYQYRKWHMLWTVTVFPFSVETIVKAWPEMHERERCWFPAHIAAQKVSQPDLQSLIASLPAILAPA